MEFQLPPKLTTHDELQLVLQGIVNKNTAVIWDLGGVLDTYDFGPCNAKMVERSGKSPEEVGNAFDKNGLFRAYATGKLTTEQYATGVMQRLEVDMSLEEFIAINVEGAHQRPGRTIAVADDIYRRVHKQCMFSNNCDMHWTYSRQFTPHLFFPFDACWSSHEVGILKPDDEFFEFVERQIPTARRYVLVDDRSENIRGAIARGWKGILYSCRG